MSEIKLLHCPFCKEELEIIGKGHYFAHKSNNGCILQHLCFEIEDKEALKAWDTRKPVEDVLERLEEELKLSEKEKERCDSENPLQFEIANGYMNGISNAIEIIKEGLME